jgi:hypothetical protein
MEPVETGIAREIAESFKTDGDIDSESQRRLAPLHRRAARGLCQCLWRRWWWQSLGVLAELGSANPISAIESSLR